MAPQTGAVCGGYSSLNVGQVPSACGAAFAEWLYSKVLPAPPGTVTIGWDPPLAVPGTQVATNLSITNMGPQPMTGASLGGALPAGSAVSFVSVSTSTKGYACKVAASSFTCTGPSTSITEYQTASLQIVVAVATNAPPGPVTLYFGATDTAKGPEATFITSEQLQVAPSGVSVLMPGSSPLLNPTGMGYTNVSVVNNTPEAAPATVTLTSDGPYQFALTSALGGQCSGTTCTFASLAPNAGAVISVAYLAQGAGGVVPGTQVTGTFATTSSGGSHSTAITYTAAPAGTVGAPLTGASPPAVPAPSASA
jgi:uncharacterized repeat protein (TIGR01451 family)